MDRTKELADNVKKAEEAYLALKTKGGATVEEFRELRNAEQKARQDFTEEVLGVRNERRFLEAYGIVYGKEAARLSNADYVRRANPR